jgi:hypothetical protein
MTDVPATQDAAQPPKPVVRSTGTTPTPATNADLSPQDRWLNDKSAADRADPWRNPNIVLTRNERGELVQKAKSTGANGEPTAGDVVDQRPGDGEERPAARQSASNLATASNSLKRKSAI